jgi:hypothetical protein
LWGCAYLDLIFQSLSHFLQLWSDSIRSSLAVSLSFPSANLYKLADLAKSKFACIPYSTSNSKVRGLRPNTQQKVLHLCSVQGIRTT